MEDLTFFDCNCRVGMRSTVNPGSFYGTNELMGKLNGYGIKKALVYHSMAREYDPMTGNGLLLDEIRDSAFFYPVWVIMPHFTGEFFEPDELIRQMRVNKIRAVRMFPADSEQNFSIGEWNCGKLFNVIEQYGIPFFIGLDQLSWENLYELCSNHKNLKIILTDVNYRIDRNIYPILSEFPNLHIETSGYKVHQGIEEICRKFGAGRLVFGSGMPVFSGAGAVSMINYARIGEDEKKAIASENLETILQGVKLWQE